MAKVMRKPVTNLSRSAILRFAGAVAAGTGVVFILLGLAATLYVLLVPPHPPLASSIWSDLIYVRDGIALVLASWVFDEAAHVAKARGS